MTEKEINKLVSDNINYVKSVANLYRGNGVDFDDLVSEGTLAMLTAAQNTMPNAVRSLWLMHPLSFARRCSRQSTSRQHSIVYQRIRKSMLHAMLQKLFPSMPYQ